MIIDFSILPEAFLSRTSTEVVREMEECGITLGLVHGRVGVTGEACLSPESLNHLVTEHSGRLICAVAVDPRSLEQSMEIIENEVVHRVMKAVVLEPGLLPCHWFADDRRLYPLYDYCSRAGVPVILHVGGNAGPDILHTHPGQADHIATDFPALNIVIRHGGWPWLPHILHVAFRRHNIYVAPGRYMFEMPGWQDYVTAANSYLRDRLLFASDYPQTAFACVEHFVKLPFKPEVLPLLLEHNAARLLNMMP